MQTDTTHIWKPANKYLGYTTLGEYKFDTENKKWMVYSSLTGWRESRNSEEWFAGEIIQGYFVAKEN